MPSLADKLAIQSWCFRAVKDHPSVIQWLLACGVNHVEICGYHLDPTLDRDYLPDLELYRQAGITLSCYGVQYFGPDESKARKALAFAKHCGMSMISADFESHPNSIPLADKLAAEYQVRIGIHNHGRKHHLGAPRDLEALFAKTSPWIGLCLDTAWMLDSGYNPVEMAIKFAPRLYGLHIKDFTFDRAGKPTDVVVGTGNLPLAQLLQHLTTTGWDGSFTLEYEGDKENPVPALKNCVDQIRSLLS